MERWQQIESLFQEALHHDPAERDAWLREACPEDSGLRREVSSLLANHHQATDFEPWAAAAAGQLVGERASLEPGHRLGHDYAHSFPWFLPDGRHFLFAGQGQANSDVMLRIGALDSPEVKTVGQANSNAVYSGGYLLFLRQSMLMAQPFDERRLAVSGEAAPVAEQAQRGFFTGTFTGAEFSVSRAGLLAYPAGAAGGQQLTWFDRSGKALGTLGDAGEFGSLEFSPDRKSVAVNPQGRNNDIWIYDVARGLPRRFTLKLAVYRDPVWSPDGRSIAYISNIGGRMDIYRKTVDGTGKEELLYADEEAKWSTSWSPDGKSLLFMRRDAKAPHSLWVLPLGARNAASIALKPFSWLATPFNEGWAKFSPDGRWVAYSSDVSGRPEIYVALFPGPDGQRQISAGGGAYPRWRADGKEIFYAAPNGRLMATAVSVRGASIEARASRPLNISVLIGRGYQYDVSADGQHFLVTARGQQPPASLTLIQNWTALLKKK